MAIVLLGKSECVLCGEKITDHTFVCFQYCEAADDELRRFSDACAHYGCLEKYSGRDRLERVYADVLGADGVHANGRRVSTCDSGLRLAVGARGTTVCVPMLFLTLEIPASTVEEWSLSPFWDMAPLGNSSAFEGKGLAVNIDRLGDECETTVRQCGWAYLPSACPDPILLQERCRRASRDLTAKCWRDVRDALTSVMQR